MTASLTRYLKDFSTPPAAPVPVVAFEIDNDFHFEPPAPEPSIDLEAERATAFAEGRAEGEAVSDARWEAERERLVAEHEAALIELRHEMERQTAERLVESLERMREEAAVALETAVTAVLAPVMEDAVAQAMVSELAHQVIEVLKSEDIAKVTVHGSQSLFEMFTKALGENAPEMRHIETPDLDLSVDINEAVLVTRLSAWAGSLKKVLA
ncbi:hypothetical protein [Rhizobium sp. FKY42]|uniref:hypothetical protein n=1 Tax=Rhizobium sp. FKY42 TaxID=2562310 RepID=UPI0010C11495|nr:hypothetical protein [Rhizobium sp. FKY42]